MKALCLTVLFLTAATAAANSATITFEAGTHSEFTGSATEAGFTYYDASGYLYLNTHGVPDGDMEGEVSKGGGLLDIVSTSPALFTFQQVDFAAFSFVTIPLSLAVTGYLGGVAVGTDTYTITPTNNYGPPIANFTTETALGLAGKSLDLLQFNLLGGLTNTTSYYDAVDNVVLGTTAATTPEPGSLMLICTGTLALAGGLRRRVTR